MVASNASQATLAFASVFATKVWKQRQTVPLHIKGHKKEVGKTFKHVDLLR